MDKNKPKTYHMIALAHLRKSAKSIALILGIAILNCCTDETPMKSPHTLPVVLQEWLDNTATSPLIDFSYAGYQLGEVLPKVIPDTLPQFNVSSYGAWPDDGRDDIDGIQAAIDAAAAAGGGIVRLPPGQFDFDVETQQRFLHIYSSNIVLLGSGEGADGTTIFDHHPSRTPEPGKPWLAGAFPSFLYVGKTLPLERKPPFADSANLVTRVRPAGRGSQLIEIEDPDRIEPGTTYLLTMQEASDTSLVKTLTYPIPRLGKNQRSIKGERRYKVQQLVHITQLEGRRARLYAPLTLALEERWHPKLWRVPDLLHHIGVAGFRIKNNWEEEFHHHLNGIHDNGYDGVKFSFVENGWVQSVIAYNTSSLVSLYGSKNCSVFKCQIRGNPGHNGYTVGGASTRNLLFNCRGGKAMHTFALSGTASGNVFFNCSSAEPSAVDLHSGLGISNLFDNLSGPVFKHGGNPNNLPPALGPGQVFWNWRVGRYEPYKGRLINSMGKLEGLPAFISVGVSGMAGQLLYYQAGERKIVTDIDTMKTRIEHFNRTAPPHPPSLFLFQRQKRLGSDPFLPL